MGNTARVIVVADSENELIHLIGVAQARLTQLETRWSRFISTSEVSQLNTALITPLVIHLTRMFINS